jgi:F-type H+-transporting ATPase subunit delta
MIASIARRYARALLEIAADTNAVDEIGGQLQGLAQAMQQSPELRGLLSNPAFSREARQRSFDAIASALQLIPALANLVRLLIDRERAAQLDQVARIYRDLSDERAGRARAQVRAATALSPDQVREIETVLSKAVSRTVTAEAKVEPELLGGAVAQVGSFLFDGSIKGQLRELRRELKQA